MKKIGRYVKLMGVFAKYSLMSALEYRINFVTGVSVEMGWMIIKLLYVAIIYKAGTNIGILTPYWKWQAPHRYRRPASPSPS